MMSLTNETLICLIPKMAQPDSIPQYQPINLCNTLYKLVTNIMVNRIRPTLPFLIFPNQRSFILGRKCTDDVMIVQETLYILRNMTSRKGGFTIEIDLEKTYD